MLKIDMISAYYVAYNRYGINIVNRWEVTAHATRNAAEDALEQIGEYDNTGNIVAMTANYDTAANIVTDEYNANHALDSNSDTTGAQYIVLDKYGTLRAEPRTLYDVDAGEQVELAPGAPTDPTQLIIDNVSDAMDQDDDIARAILDGARDYTDYYDLPLLYLYDKPDRDRIGGSLRAIASSILNDN